MNAQERKKYKQQAHSLKPVVIVGQHGLTPAVIAAIDEALISHELIKIKLPADKQANVSTIQKICDQLKAEHIQTVGYVATVYRFNPEKV